MVADLVAGPITDWTMDDDGIFDGRWSNHDVDDKACGSCWPDYPVECDCGGLVHAEFGDEDSDCNYYLNYRCDRCGDRSPA